MTNVRPLLPRLTLNRRFARELTWSEGACCALGVIEERKQIFALLALRPPVTIGSRASVHGFEFGHRLLGSDAWEVVQLTFEFCGFATYHVLVNPSSPVAQRVLDLMAARGGFFVLVANSDGTANAFRSDLGTDGLSGFKALWPRIQRSTTTEAQYRAVVEVFSKEPMPPGQLLSWVCRSDTGLLDMANDRMELRPA
jgi:hypothetical protein